MLSYPARVLLTGVPVFLGLISLADLKVCNARLPDDRQFVRHILPKAPQLSIVRQSGAMRLPARAYSPAADLQISDQSSENFRLYLRAGAPMPATPHNVQADSAIDDSAPVSASAIEPKPQRFTMWPEFKNTYGDLDRCGFLTHAVYGFFENKGDLCYVQVICFEDALTDGLMREALATLAPYTEYDLVCAPDLGWLASQQHLQSLT